MKKLIFLVLVATVFFLSPANAQEKPNSGFLQEVKDAHAHGQKGRISRYLQSRETDDEGVYIEYGNYTVLGVKIWVIRVHESEGWQMKFSDGQYAYWNRNWGYLREGRVVWGYGDMPQFELVNGFDRIPYGVYDNYCSNHGGIQRPHIKVVEKTVYKREGTLLKIDGQKVDHTGTISSNTNTNTTVFDEEVDNSTPQESFDSQEYEFNFPGGQCYKQWVEKYPYVFEQMATYGNQLTLRDAKKIIRRYVKGKDRRAMLKCITGKSWFARNFWWVVPAGTTFLAALVYVAMKIIESISQKKETPPTPPTPPGPQTPPTGPDGMANPSWGNFSTGSGSGGIANPSWGGIPSGSSGFGG